MFGKNEVSGPRYDEDFLVKEIFPTIQGEGPFSGQPAVFLRLGGCNLRCYFCDTDFSSELKEANEKALALSCEFVRADVKTDLLVVTGGEPMLHDLPRLIYALRAEQTGFRRVQIETAGTVWPPGLEHHMARRRADEIDVSIVVSPKTTQVHPNVRKWAMAWKYIVNAENCLNTNDGLPGTSTQVRNKVTPLARPIDPPRHIYVQPMDEGDPEKNAANRKAAADIAMRFGYRVSIQLHKVLGVE